MEENMQNNNVNAPQQGGKGLSIASMVLGIISVVLFCVAYISIPCGVVGLILGGVALATKKPGKGMAIAGLVCSVVGIALYALAAAAVLSLF